MSRIAIIGGHGKVALELTPLLAEEDHTVTSVIRNPDHVRDVESAGGTPVLADVAELDVDGIAEVVADHDVVVWSAGAGGGNPDRTYAVDRDAAIRSMDAAARAGVQRYVMVSYCGAGPDHGVEPDSPFFPYAEAKAAADEHLRGTDLDWTVLGPSKLTDGPSTGAIEVASRAEGSGEVSRGNVARVIAESIESNGTVRRTIEFHDGSTPITEALR
ncbi:SDR family oxidoreductase [Janibacter sp. DB-40]|uniref:NAD(P)-dependent oxidoreductase n=1 Tax=Janibacter sp. DB-40 TaxID=3028808 RepID=UPI00240759B5|nr:SDR family oxidoreductase [Janibacter sp. DB-40]